MFSESGAARPQIPAGLGLIDDEVSVQLRPPSVVLYKNVSSEPQKTEPGRREFNAAQILAAGELQLPGLAAIAGMVDLAFAAGGPANGIVDKKDIIIAASGVGDAGYRPFTLCVA